MSEIDQSKNNDEALAPLSDVPLPETPRPPEVRHLKESDLSEEARRRIFNCLAAPPSPYRSNSGRPQFPAWKKHKPT
ncbi:hypothetical protein [Nitrospirillum sp. BR 11163]|uniref:hypothetical protein n=1 Tax=Nitrospirillum sp. BR 11163 TaxID=3104323 RepID=UPI002AFF2D3A|nr:hypothetical protein [Nitrospirillum sp. BR 11163]MEA1671922.1 hypothetical protein [Nitrospirillum sp. BR 11163]